MNNFWFSVGILTATAMAVACLAPVVASGALRFVSTPGHRAAFALLAVGLCIYAGAKHGVPIVEKPSWLNVSVDVDTNTWDRATFSWIAIGTLPGSTPIYIDTAKPQGATTNWTVHATTYQVGSMLILFDENPTNYIARVRSDYIPGKVEITDFMAMASLTNRIVDITFSAPTNLVGQTGVVEYRMIKPSSPWTPITTHVATTNNHVRAVGNFISRGRLREFRIRFGNDIIYPLENAR